MKARATKEMKENKDLFLVPQGKIVSLWIGGIRLGALSLSIQGGGEVTLPVVPVLRSIESIGL